MTAPRTPADLKRTIAWLKQHGRAEGLFAAALSGVFQRVGGTVKTDVLEALDALDDDGELTDEELADILDVEEIYDEVMKEARPAVRGMVLQGALAEFGLFRRTRGYAAWLKKRGGRQDLDIDLPPDMEAAVDAHAELILEKPYWRDLAETVRNDVARTVQRGVKAGRSNDEIAEDLDEVLGEDGSDARALRIARTEATGSLGGGAQAVREKLAEDGLVKGKRWLIIDDDDVRPEHEDANEQVVAVDEPFVVGNEECMYPGDPNLSAGMRVY